MSSYVHIKGHTEKQGKWFCCECKNWLNVLNEEHECMGEFWGVPAYDTFYYCPVCGSDYIVDANDVILDDVEELVE